ncbi:MAG: very short patch repair endonuclease [Desulfovibrionaceae bacterium]|nr:very short patch repair endonuclease [Desulfovibrionaceae bacterium]
MEYLFHIREKAIIFLLSRLCCNKDVLRVYLKQMDSVSPEKRGWIMAQVKGHDTGPEMAVRSLLHRMGYRFRLQRKDLPGKPDIVLPKYRVAIFVHGCYWHRHDCSNGRRHPKSHLDFWLPKLEGNRERDIQKQALLREQGWNILVIWECMLRDTSALQEIIRVFLEGVGRD